MTDNTDDDIYGKLGQDWWEKAGEEVRATPQQIKFSAARYSGNTRSKSARLAGYAGDAQGIRSAGSRADDTETVKALIAMAAAAEAGTVSDQYTVAQAKLKVGNLVKHSRDPLIVFKGTEVLSRLEKDEVALNDARGEESPEEVLASVIAAVPESAVGAFLAMSTFRSNVGNILNFPFLRECGPIIARTYPAEWAEWRAKESGPGQQWGAFLDQIAKGPLLECDELIAAVKSKLPARTIKPIEPVNAA